MPSEKRPPDAGEASTRKTGELLAAYVDGVGEMSVEERRRVERYLASEPAARGDQIATREVLDQLRALDEPDTQDWAAMEAAIHAEVGDEVPRRSWLSRVTGVGSPGGSVSRWRVALPAFAFIGAVIAILVIRSRTADDEGMPIAFVPKTEVQQPVFAEIDQRVTVYLDGIDLEIGLDTAKAADDELDDLMFARASDVSDDEASLGFLETSDLGWIDELDDDELTRAERLLDRPFHPRKGS